MSHTEHIEPIFRTSPERTAKMMAIVLGICVVGAVIFFGMWDYWTSVTPVAGRGPVSEVKAPTTVTGKEIPILLAFVESSDFRTLAFNALPEEEGHNPEIRITAGDSVTIKATNTGKSFHAFGVVTNPEDPNSLVWNSAIQSATNPLKPGESGEVTFTTDVPGTYYYICTVPGHSIQGMQGKFIVE